MDLDAYESLRAKIGSNQIRVGIIGLGYVGLPLALAFARQGLSVLGFDTDPIKVDRLARRELHRAHLAAIPSGKR